MIFLALIISVIAVILLQKYIYTKYAFNNLTYRVTLSTSEVFEGEEIYIYEEIANNKFLPLPFLKVDTELPDGLSFHLVETENDKTTETHPNIIHSIFVLRSYQMIRRRWRVRCNIRGTYTLGNVTMLADNIIGSNLAAHVITAEPEHANTLVVLPKAVNLEKEFTSSKYSSGLFLVKRSLISDPLLKAGVREYVAGDPLNRINWIQTAVHGNLMTNIEEFTNRHQFNIVMNMQARDLEKSIPGPPTSRHLVELCITVAASILDSVSHENTPVRFISNTDYSKFGEELNAARNPEDEIGSKIFVSPQFRGKIDMINALRMLAQLDLFISVPIEKMLDHMLDNPFGYTNGGNIIFVSSYLSERMINFYYAMKKYGINIIFYITSASINAQIIPDDIEVHFKTYIEK